MKKKFWPRPTTPLRGDVAEITFDLYQLARTGGAPAIAVLLQLNVLVKRPKSDGTLTWGAENKLAIYAPTGLPIDLFATTHEKWFNYLVCRTGPSASNIRICEAAQARGWKWNPYGNGFTRENPSGARVVTSEQDVFSFVGLEYREPWER